jgi:hypothetical protein
LIFSNSESASQQRYPSSPSNTIHRSASRPTKIQPKQQDMIPTPRSTPLANLQSCVQKDREETLPIVRLNLEYMYIPDNACSAFSRRERSRIKRLMRLWLKGSFFGKLLWCAPPPSEGFPGDTAELDTTATLEVFLLLPTITWLLLLGWTLGDIICSQRGVIGAIAITISVSQSLSVSVSLSLLTVSLALHFAKHD